MSKSLTSVLPRPGWRSERARTGYHHLHYPSARARRLFYHVCSIGEARPPASFRFHHADEKGFLLHFLLKGAFWHRVKGRTEVARAGECCLLDLTEPVDYGTEGPRPVQLLWVQFDGPLMPAVYRELNADLEPVFRSPAAARIERAFRELIRLTAGQPPNYEPQASFLLAGLLADLFASRADRLPLPDEGIDPARLSEPIRKALAMISRYYMQPKSVKILAAEIGLSRYHFCRLFHRETGLTPSEYLGRYRLEAARNLLCTTAKPIQQIARAVGIPELASFSRLFHLRHGLGPRAYREKQAGPPSPDPHRAKPRGRRRAARVRL